MFLSCLVSMRGIKQRTLKKMDKIVDALKVRFFANLGEFSVNIVFSLDAPNVQDIDPYIFLSRLIDK